MLKRIPVTQLRVGMYIHELCGSWLDHPFWRSRFLVSDESRLRKLQDSRLEWVWIDTRRGEDVLLQAASGAAGTGGQGQTPPRPEEPPSPEQQAFLHARDVIEVSRDRVTQMFADAQMGRKTDLAQVERLVEDMAESIDEHPDALTSLARIKRADQYTYMHSVAVAALMTSLARGMNLTAEQTRLAGMAGLLHDIGKVQMPEKILNKPGRLTPDEYRQMQAHPVAGAAMLREDKDIPREIIEVCLHHHEHFDGSGYPDRLAGDNIFLLTRMASICDVYDAITSNRPYKKGWDPSFALHKMSQWQGQFDPRLFDAFVRTIGKYPVGSIISLTDGELGQVIGQNPGKPELPIVKVFYSIRWSHAIPERVVNLAEPDCGSAILPVRAPVDWAQSGLPVPSLLA